MPISHLISTVFNFKWPLFPEQIYLAGIIVYMYTDSWIIYYNFNSDCGFIGIFVSIPILIILTI